MLFAVGDVLSTDLDSFTIMLYNNNDDDKLCYYSTFQNQLYKMLYTANHRNKDTRMKSVLQSV